MVATRRSPLLLCILLCAVTVGSACKNGDTKELVIPHSAIEALDNYAFISHLELSAPQGDLDVLFNGVHVSPDSYQGAWESSGSWEITPFREADVIALGEQVWWREGDAEWTSSGAQAAPLLVFFANATPAFFINGLTFDEFRVGEAGPTETVNEIAAYRVRFDKSALIAALDQGSFTKEGDKDPAIVREDALAFLPEDTAIDAWLSVDDLHPVRIVVSLSTDEGDSHAQDFFLEKPFDIRLQMDITDSDADVQIEPPL